MRVNIDFETRSMADLRKTGVYPYAEHWSTEILCMSYAIDDGPVRTWSPFIPELAEIPGDLVTALSDQDVELRAWNSGFEHVIWATLGPQYGLPPVRLEQWVDTAAEAAALALPRGLGKAAQVLGLEAQKDDEGYKLMQKMCRPRCVGAWWVGGAGPFATKAEARKQHKKGKLTQDDFTVMWWEDEEKIRRLIKYCETDVETERAVAEVLRPLPPAERAVFLMNQRMNDRGVQVDMELVRASQEIMDHVLEEANFRLREITGGAVQKVTNVADMREWIQGRGVEIPDLRKDTVRDLLETELPDSVREVLTIRQEAGKTSTAKLDAFEQCVADDGRAHGLLMYHGASTGRWAGQLVQPQNFPRPEFKREELEGLIPAVLARDLPAIEQVGAPAVVISSLLRSIFTAAPGHVLLAADYSQIEARVLAWIAGQEDLVALFASGGKIYETMAAFIFDMSVKDVAKDSFERQIGKNSVLGAGFQMGADRFAEQVREQTGIILERGRYWACPKCDNDHKIWHVDDDPDRTCYLCHEKMVVRRNPEVVDVAAQALKGYRTLYHLIPQFWKDIEAAAMKAVRNPGEVYTVGHGAEIKYTYRGQFLWCQLPSKRFLAYARPEIREKRLPEPYDDIIKESLSYLGVDSLTKQWRRHYTYGGHLTENVVQAMARDVMAGAMLRTERAGYRPILTVHDEVVVEAPEGEADFASFMELIQTLPRWATGLPLAAEGWSGERYRK
jgi:DNA polymerase